MELKFVILALGSEWDRHAGELGQRLERAGIAYRRIPVCGGENRDFEPTDGLAGEADVGQDVCVNVDDCALSAALAEHDVLVITDNRALSAVLGRQGIVCVGCSRESAFFEGAALVTDDPTSLDAETLEECFLHAKGRPVTIAVTPRLVIREIMEQDFAGLYRISRQEGMQYAFQEPQHAPRMADPGFFEPERLSAYIRQAYRLYGYGLWSVLLRDGTLIGCCGLSACGEISETCEEYRERIPGGTAAGEAEAGEESAAAERRQKEEAAGKKPASADHWPDEYDSCEDAADSLELQYMLDRKYQGYGYAQEMCRAALQFAADRMPRSRIWVRIHPDNRASLGLAQKLGFSVQGSGADAAVRTRLKHLLLRP